MKNVDTKEIIKFAGTYISVCIGSGFATGQEIMQFFSAYGMVSFIGGIVCMIVLSYCGSTLLEAGSTLKLRTIGDIYSIMCGKVIGEFFKFFMPFFFLVSFIVMIAGAGSAMNQYYGINNTVGSFIMASISLISVLLGMKKVIEILGNIGPLIVIISIGIGIVTVTRNYDNLLIVDETIKTLEMTKASESWWITPILYSGLNIIIVVPFLIGVGSTAKHKSSCIYGGILGGVLFMLAALTLNAGLLSDIQNLYQQEIPTLAMAQKIGPVVGALFSIILLAGIYSTAVPLLWNVCSNFSSEGSKEFKVIATISCTIGFVGGRLPFSYLVNLIYPVSGGLGVFIILGVINIHIWKRRNRNLNQLYIRRG